VALVWPWRHRPQASRYRRVAWTAGPRGAVASRCARCWPPPRRWNASVPGRHRLPRLHPVRLTDVFAALAAEAGFILTLDAMTKSWIGAGHAALLAPGGDLPCQPVTRGRSGWALHSVSEPSYGRASSRPVSQSAKRSTVTENLGRRHVRNIRG
jgi:hypothetical protein